MAKRKIKISVGCRICHKKGWVTQKNQTFSKATLCECVAGCVICDGMGFERKKDDSGYSFLSPCAGCGEVRRNVKLYNIAGIPSKYSEVIQADTFNYKNKKQQEALSYVADFVKKYPKKRGFLLMGAAGLGKTHLAIGAIAELTLTRGIKCIFKDFFYLLSELKTAYSTGISENEVIQPLIDVDVLVIDELGKGRSSEWELNILDQIISKRYNASKTTLITTNFITKDMVKHESDGVLEDRVGERISSRLYEMCEMIFIDGEDYRRTKRLLQSQ